MEKHNQFFIVMIFFALMISTSSFANHFNSNFNEVYEEQTNPIGVWMYTIEGAAPEYQEGVIFIRRENGAYIVDVQLASGALSGQDVQIEGDTIKFNMNIGGVERVSMLLVVAGNKISGDTYATKGNYKIKGIRKLPPQ